jgi:hypothetical protein
MVRLSLSARAIGKKLHGAVHFNKKYLFSQSAQSRPNADSFLL